MASLKITYPAILLHLLLLLAPSPSFGASLYVLEQDFSGESFFDGFDFFTAPDPTNGFVRSVLLLVNWSPSTC